MLFYRKLVACSYNLAMRKVERLCLHSWRAELLAGLRGDVLEIGAGTGANLHHYPATVRRLTLCEPDIAMRKQLVAAARKSPRAQVEIRPCAAESLNVADQSIDFLVSTLVFCSVIDPRQALKEAYRVLKPGGQLILIEHVAAVQKKRLFFWQRFWQPLWRRVACNCHLTRQTATLLADAGFRLDLREEIMRGAPAIAAPLIIGHAQRP